MTNIPGPIQKKAELAGCGRFGEVKIFGPTWIWTTIPRSSGR